VAEKALPLVTWDQSAADSGKLNCRAVVRDFPAGANAVMKCPAKAHMVEVPFEFRDISIPKNVAVPPSDGSIP